MKYVCIQLLIFLLILDSQPYFNLEFLLDFVMCV